MTRLFSLRIVRAIILVLAIVEPAAVLSGCVVERRGRGRTTVVHTNRGRGRAVGRRGGNPGRHRGHTQGRGQGRGGGRGNGNNGRGRGR